MKPPSVQTLLLQVLDNEVSENEFTLLIPKTRLVKYRADQVIFREGDFIEGIYILVSGTTKISKLNDEFKSVCIHFSHSHRFFGIPFISGLNRHSVTVHAKTDCLILQVKIKLDELHIYPEFRNKLFTELIKKSQRQEQLLTQLLTKSIAQLVAAKLAEIAHPATLRAFVTQSELAEMLGVSRQKVHYQIKKLVSDGIIASGYRWFEIKNMEQLKKRM